VSRKRLIIIGGLVFAAIVISSVVWSLRDDVAYAHIAAGYTAKTTCSCLHISERSFDSCLSDLPEDARGNFTITEDADRVRASVLFGAISAEAIYEDGFGCRIEN
jgi:hypothetical protein